MRLRRHWRHYSWPRKSLQISDRTLLKNCSMRAILLVLCSWLLPLFASGQAVVADSSMYVRALVRAVQVDLGWHKLVADWNGYTDPDKTNEHFNQLRRRPLDTVFFVYDALKISEKLPTVVNGVQVVCFKDYDENDQKIVRLRAKKGFWVWQIFPPSQEGRLIVIGFNHYAVRREQRKGIEMGLSDGVHVKFSYDCDKQAFVVKEVETWGI